MPLGGDPGGTGYRDNDRGHRGTPGGLSLIKIDLRGLSGHPNGPQRNGAECCIDQARGSGSERKSSIKRKTPKNYKSHDCLGYIPCNTTPPTAAAPMGNINIREARHNPDPAMFLSQ